jgi:hypothetical protein
MITRARNAFTLFELILAIGLSVALVSLIGTAIDLYLTRVDKSRVQVEEAQLARTVLAMIADDLRAATIYKPQDTSSIAQLMQIGTPFDVDSIDQPGGGLSGGGGQGGSGGGGGSGSGGSSFGSSSGTGGGGLASGGASAGMSSVGGATSGETETTMPLGLNGTLDELYVDSTRLPRREELFATATGYTNAPLGVQAGAGGAPGSMAAAASLSRPSDLKTVRYFIRPGAQVERGSAATTSLDPAAQMEAGGLVRQEIPRNMRVWAEQSGNTAVLDSGQALLAPEVVHIEFRYFDGTQVVEYWDMRERSALPVGVEVKLWIAPATDESGANSASSFNPASLANTARLYQQTVYLPMSQVGGSGAGGMGGGGGMSTGSGTGSGSGMSTSGSSTSGGSSFGQQ